MKHTDLTIFDQFGMVLAVFDTSGIPSPESLLRWILLGAQDHESWVGAVNQGRQKLSAANGISRQLTEKVAA